MPPNNLSPGNVPNRPPLSGPVPNVDQHQNLFHQMHFNQQPNHFNNQQHSNNMNQQRFPQPMSFNNKQFPQNQQFPPGQQQFPNNQQFPHGQQPFPNNQQFNSNVMPSNQQIPLNQHNNMNQMNTHQRTLPNQQMNTRNNPQNNMNQMLNKNSAMSRTGSNNRPFSNFPNGPGNKNQSDTNNLIQMIQNTHPMLQNNMHTGFVNAIVANSMLARGMLQHNNQSNYNNNQGAMQRNSGNSDNRQHGADADPYSGLMSAREKQWLMNIQMMQLNTGTPYIDDYYYMVGNICIILIKIKNYVHCVRVFVVFRCFWKEKQKNKRKR